MQSKTTMFLLLCIVLGELVSVRGLPIDNERYYVSMFLFIAYLIKCLFNQNQEIISQ